MTSPRLEKLADIGQLHRTRASTGEITHLVTNGQVRLRDARNAGLAPESRFDLAYNAAHSLALAALRIAGYRSDNRFTVFQVLEETAGIPAAQWRVLAKAHEARNLMEYEGEGEVDQRLLDDIIAVAEEVESAVIRLIK